MITDKLAIDVEITFSMLEFSKLKAVAEKLDKSIPETLKFCLNAKCDELLSSVTDT